ncbi:MAG: hypothetical protein L0206_04030, partial [Actinobacteria bacterium]|nr:hypothetical protein [Actinomycetota bacterium]
SAGDPFLGSTVDRFHDVAAGDGGEWFAAVSVSPPLGTPLTVIHGALGADGAFTPGLVANLPGAAAHLVNEPARGDYLQSGTTITVTSVIHGLMPGEQVRLNFRTASSGAPPADGFFTVQSVLHDSAFTVVHGTAGNCGTVLSPCGQVDLVRTVQPVDLNYSRACLPAYQGVMQMTDDDVPGTPPVITPTRADGGVFWNSILLLREGALSGAPQVGAGTIYTRIVRSVVDSRQDCLVLTRMDDPSVAGIEDALVRLDVSSACPPALLSEQVLARTGDTLQNIGNRKFRGFLTFEKRSFALNERGDFMYVATLTEPNGLPATDSPVVVNNRAVLFAFQQVPGGTGPMVHFPMVSLDLDDLGDYVVQVKVQEGAPPNNAEYGEALLKGHVNGVN